MLKMLLLCLMVTLSIASAVLYLLPIIFLGGVKSEASPMRRKLDIFLQHVQGILAIIVAILAMAHFIQEY
jgi:hypothetical protein